MLGLALTAPLAPAAAQDRLVGLRALGGGVTYESVRFGGGGLRQSSEEAGTAADSLRLRSARQLTIPVTAAVPLGDVWTLDVTSVYASGVASYEVAGARGRATATLSGVSDVRVRATGRFGGDALVLTLGANAPTGRSRLDAEQLTAVRVLAAPALALSAPPVGAGGSATVGVLTARRAGGWAVAAGASYELHDAYSPIAALETGGSATSFRPGDVMRASFGADGLVGRHRLSLSASGDFFGSDRVRGGATADGPSRVRLGPVLAADAQLYLAVPGVREAVVWGASRWRASFARDGVRVTGSRGTYLDGGTRVVAPLGARTDLLAAIDGRWQSGLAFDDALLTAQASAGAATFGIARRIGGVTLQPFARAQVGHVRASALASAPFAGGSLGVTMLSRF